MTPQPSALPFPPPAHPSNTRHSDRRGTPSLDRDMITGFTMQKPARIDLLKNLSDPEARRDRVEALLWKAFPARSRAAMARKAASALGCSQSTIINWTRGEGGPDLRQTAALVTILGLRAFIRILHRGRL